jgi:hypothetical protein
MDNLPYLLIDDFVYEELTSFDRLVMPWVPGVQLPIYQLQREETLREFCRRSGALIGLHNPILIYEDVSTYDLNAVPELLDILTIKQMRYTENGRPVNEAAYLIDQNRKTFTLQSSWPGSLQEQMISPVVSLTACRGAERVESDFFERWADTIAKGIAAALMKMPKKQWTNPQAALEFDHQYESGIANAKIAVSRGFSKYAPHTIVGGFE